MKPSSNGTVRWLWLCRHHFSNRANFDFKIATRMWLHFAHSLHFTWTRLRIHISFIFCMPSIFSDSVSFVFFSFWSIQNRNKLIPMSTTVTQAIAENSAIWNVNLSDFSSICPFKLRNGKDPFWVLHYEFVQVKIIWKINIFLNFSAILTSNWQNVLSTNWNNQNTNHSCMNLKCTKFGW